MSENGQYRIPNDNPFVSTPGARKEIFAYGMRNPHRMAWDVPTGPGSQARLLAFVIGSNMGSPVRYETINIIRRGANYGYPLREGPESKPESPIYGPLSADNTLPLRISDTVVLDRRIPIQDSALAYKTGVEGLAIANGFVYRGKRWPALQGAVVFGDITSGRLFYARMADLDAATDGNPTTLAPYAEIKTNLPTLVQERIKASAPAAGPAAPAPAAGPAGRASDPCRRLRGRLHLHRPRACDGRLRLRQRPGLRRDRLRRRPAPRLGVRVDLLRVRGHFGSSCASQPMRPERSIS